MATITEDYKEKLKEALNSDNTDYEVVRWIEQNFPELKESEDEKIRKELIRAFNSLNTIKVWNGIERTDILAWLEKQGEQESVKVPKFKAGDWVVFNNTHNSIYQVEKIENYQYTIRHILGGSMPLSYSSENMLRRWTIQDAKSGDVLCCESGWTCIFKTLVNDETFSSYCFMDSTKWFCETGSECHTLKEEFVKAYNGKIYPATKEQRSKLFSKMAEEGYEWDAENLELKKVEQKPNPCDGCINRKGCINCENGELREVEQNPAWSEEDEKQARQIERIVRDDGCTQKLQKQIADWFESLKDRVQPQPKQEWSEEDEKMLDAAIGAVGIADYYTYDDKKEIEIWLKSLRPQSTWKPSDEQLNNILDVLSFDNCTPKRRELLESLLSDLKKLK